MHRRREEPEKHTKVWQKEAIIIKESAAYQPAQKLDIMSSKVSGTSGRAKGKRRTKLLRRYIGRHIVLLLGILLLIAYYALRENPELANYVTKNIAQPWHRIAGKVTSSVPYSLAEWLIVLIIVCIVIYLIIVLIQIIRKKRKLQRLYGAFITLLAVAVMAFSGISWLWSIGYYSSTYSELSGIETRPISVEELKEVTIYFAVVASSAGEQVNRDENGLYTCDTQQIFSDAPELYAKLPRQFSFMRGREMRDVSPKPLFFSYIMSHMNFSGVFFPFTGEANVNVDVVDCFIPSCAAHELSHQRGVVREQDANFTAVMVCMESGKPDFTYSGALLAYIHLADALYEASYEDWVEASYYLSENVIRDLVANNQYWAQFNTPVAEVSTNAYDGFLQHQGQELGMKSYGACVDLLVAYYGDTARATLLERQTGLEPATISLEG